MDLLPLYVTSTFKKGILLNRTSISDLIRIYEQENFRTKDKVGWFLDFWRGVLVSGNSFLFEK